MTDEFKQYRRRQIAELRPYVPGEDLRGVSISEADLKGGSPKPGDMIARNPKNHDDRWLVEMQYFRDNFEPVTLERVVSPREDSSEDCKQTYQSGPRLIYLKSKSFYPGQHCRPCRNLTIGRIYWDGR